MNQAVEPSLVEPETQARRPAFWRRFPILSAAIVASALGMIYWSLIASDRYVSESHVIVQKADLNVSQSFDFSNLLGSFVGGNSHEDQMLLRDYLLSLDMLNKLDAELHLRRHYASHDYDIISRMWAEDEPVEWFYKYFLKHVSITFDDYTGVLRISVQAFTPGMAQAITRMMLHEGEIFMNDLSHRLALEQVHFLEEQVEKLKHRAQEARNKVIQFQNQREMVSPQAAVESRVALIAKLEGTRADLQTKLTAMKAYLVSSNPTVRQIKQQIQAIKKQIEKEKKHLASVNQGETLNRALEEYQRLDLEANLTEEAYKTALVALEKGRVEASRKLKKVSVVQQPSLPQYPERPRRLYNSVITVLFMMMIAGLIHLMAAVVRDHKD